MKNSLWFIFLLASLLAQVHAQAQTQTQTQTEAENPLDRIINSQSPEFQQSLKDNEVQIIYTQINRNKDNEPSFIDFTYGVDTTRYFYPASSIKMPIAILALEKLNKLGIQKLDEHTPMYHGATKELQTSVVQDSSAASGYASVAHYIRKIFTVSDNDAYNRLFEFLGAAYINDQLWDKGFTSSRLIHRLAIFGIDNRSTNPICFADEDGLLYFQNEGYSTYSKSLNLKGQLKGKAYSTNEGELIAEPFDFRKKNFITITDLHQILRSVLFPQSVELQNQFDLSPKQYQLLLDEMQRLPKESTHPKYDKPDNYVKFWIYGDQENGDIPEHIRIFNKVGWAYGFLTDVAYIIDTKNNIEFMVSAVIHVNDNQTFNDGVYEYESEGLPFFGIMGRALLDYEQNRKRSYPPNLSAFNMKN